MLPDDIFYVLVAACLSALATWRVRRHALLSGMLDVPNTRSSHSRPTPRGGGLAMVLAIALGLMGLGSWSAVDAGIFLLPGIAGMGVAGIGYLDDKRSVPAMPRFGVHLLAATIAAATLLNQSEALPLVDGVPGWLALAISVLGIVWSINLFNFMDGIDGIAGSQAVFVAGAAAMLASPDANAWTGACALTAGAGLGFLAWNWPPAKIFMGDVGSGFLGFWLAILALGMHLAGTLSLWTSITLGSVFIADSTVTLIRRLIRAERWYQAHRSHAYQRLARRWASHLKVTGLLWGINLFFILPLAGVSAFWPQTGIWIACAVLLALALGCWAAGAGKSDD